MQHYDMIYKHRSIIDYSMHEPNITTQQYSQPFLNNIVLKQPFNDGI